MAIGGLALGLAAGLGLAQMASSIHVVISENPIRFRFQALAARARDGRNTSVTRQENWPLG
jgi:hypothetical protein